MRKLREESEKLGNGRWKMEDVKRETKDVKGKR